jgi:hypothetical protein
MLALVTGIFVDRCPWCRRPAGFVEFRKGEAKWQRIEPHNCTAVTTAPREGAALSDLVDEHEEGGIGA